jgi:hypothetical protein
VSAHDILDNIEPQAVVGNTGDGFDDPALGFAVAASIAISLKRIADALWGMPDTTGIVQMLGFIEQSVRR